MLAIGAAYFLKWASLSFSMDTLAHFLLFFIMGLILSPPDIIEQLIYVFITPLKLAT